MADTAELERLQDKWKRRLYAVTKANEQVMYVTHEEYAEIRHMESMRVECEPEQVTLRRNLEKSLSGAIGNLFATSIVIDEEEWDKQRTRIELDDAPVTD